MSFFLTNNRIYLFLPILYLILSNVMFLIIFISERKYQVLCIHCIDFIKLEDGVVFFLA